MAFTYTVEGSALNSQTTKELLTLIAAMLLCCGFFFAAGGAGGVTRGAPGTNLKQKKILNSGKRTTRKYLEKLYANNADMETLETIVKSSGNISRNSGE
jgi:hypothetical protein